MSPTDPVRRSPGPSHRIPGALVPTSRSSVLRGLESAWSAVSYLVGGVIVWGGVGFLLDRVLGTDPVLTVIGAFVGNAAGIYLIYLRWPIGEDDRRAP